MAARGLGPDAQLARRGPAGVPAVLRLGARQLVECTPGRPWVRPSVRRPAAGQGSPRSRWLTALGVDAPRVTWGTPTTCPAWRPREPVAAVPETVGRREGRYGVGPPGFRTRLRPLGTTRLAPERSPVADPAELDRPRGPSETAVAHLTTTMQLDGRHGNTVPGVLTALPVGALVDPLVRRVRWHSAPLQRLSVARRSFLDARRWRGAPHPGTPLSALIVNLIRPPRVEPRVQKRRPQRFPWMSTPRQARRQQLAHQGLGA